MARELAVYRIEYEKLPNMEAFTAYVAAYTHEAAVDYVRRIQKGKVHITATGYNSRLDGIDDEVCNKVIQNYRPSEDVQRALGVRLIDLNEFEEVASEASEANGDSDAKRKSSFKRK